MYKIFKKIKNTPFDAERIAGYFMLLDEPTLKKLTLIVDIIHVQVCEANVAEFVVDSVHYQRNSNFMLLNKRVYIIADNSVYVNSLGNIIIKEVATNKDGTLKEGYHLQYDWFGSYADTGMQRKAMVEAEIERHDNFTPCKFDMQPNGFDIIQF